MLSLIGGLDSSAEAPIRERGRSRMQGQVVDMLRKEYINVHRHRPLIKTAVTQVITGEKESTDSSGS